MATTIPSDTDKQNGVNTEKQPSGNNPVLSGTVYAVFVSIFVFSLYHLVRDILQIAGLHSPFTNILHWDHRWCRGFCDTITLPLDLVGLAGSFIVLRRNRVGLLGCLTLIFLLLWPIALLVP